jgi:hypothetical protein
MKPILVFVLGAVASAGVVYVVMNKQPAAAPVPVATASVPAVNSTPPPEAAPTPTPDAAPPAAAVDTPPPPPAQPEPVQGNRRPSPMMRPKRDPVPLPRQNQASDNPPPQQTAQNGPPPAAAPPEPAPQPGPAPVVEQPKPVEQAPPPPPAPRQPATVTIPAGTSLSIRLDEAISTDNRQSGDQFRAVLDQPLVVDGFVIAERGARALGRLVEVEKAGRVKGLAKLTLELTSVTSSDGQRVTLRTSPFTKEGPTSKGRDAGEIGGGAALGAIIGAIAGGGRGAAIGAGAGGAAGAGGVAMQRGKAATLPIETRLTFRTQEPVTVTERLRN